MNKNYFTFLLLPIYFYFAYQYWTNPDFWNLLDGVNLLIHEAGHFIFLIFGEFISIAGGSFFQLLVPILFIGYFIKKRDFTGASFAVFWLGTSLFHLATYIGDAQEMALPLLVEGTIHDWNYLLTRTNVLQFDDVFANCTRMLGWICMYVAILLIFIKKDFFQKLEKVTNK